MPGIIIAVVASLIVALPLGYFIGSRHQKTLTEAKIGNAETKAREIIDEALKTAEEKKRLGMLEVKEESYRVKKSMRKSIMNVEKNFNAWKTVFSKKKRI